MESLSNSFFLRESKHDLLEFDSFLNSRVKPLREMTADYFKSAGFYARLNESGRFELIINRLTEENFPHEVHELLNSIDDLLGASYREIDTDYAKDATFVWDVDSPTRDHLRKMFGDNDFAPGL